MTLLVRVTPLAGKTSLLPQALRPDRLTLLTGKRSRPKPRGDGYRSLFRGDAGFVPGITGGDKKREGGRLARCRRCTAAPVLPAAPAPNGAEARPDSYPGRARGTFGLARNNHPPKALRFLGTTGEPLETAPSGEGAAGRLSAICGLIGWRRRRRYGRLFLGGVGLVIRRIAPILTGTPGAFAILESLLFLKGSRRRQIDHAGSATYLSLVALVITVICMYSRSQKEQRRHSNHNSSNFPHGLTPLLSDPVFRPEGGRAGVRPGRPTPRTRPPGKAPMQADTAGSTLSPPTIEISAGLFSDRRCETRQGRRAPREKFRHGFCAHLQPGNSTPGQLPFAQTASPDGGTRA